MKVLGSTLNKKVKAEIAKMFPSADKIEKVYVSAWGYVWYIIENGNRIGRVHKACIGEEGVIKSYMVINEIKSVDMTEEKVKHVEQVIEKNHMTSRVTKAINLLKTAEDAQFTLNWLKKDCCWSSGVWEYIISKSGVYIK